MILKISIWWKKQKPWIWLWWRAESFYLFYTLQRWWLFCWLVARLIAWVRMFGVNRLKELVRLGFQVPRARKVMSNQIKKEWGPGLPKAKEVPQCMVARSQRIQSLQVDFMRKTLEDHWGIYPHHSQVSVLAGYTNSFWVLRNLFFFCDLLDKTRLNLVDVLKLRSLFSPFTEILQIYRTMNKNQVGGDLLLPEFVVEPLQDSYGYYKPFATSLEAHRLRVFTRNSKLLEAKATWEFEVFLKIQHFILDADIIDSKKKLRGLRWLEIRYGVYEG